MNNDNHNVNTDLNEEQLPNMHPDILKGKGASLVNNIGTGEHVFDQGAVFANMHNLCKVGGVMFYHLPFTPWLNHGFYNYNPILFEALAVANDYDLIGLQVGDREGDMVNLPFDEIVKERGQFPLEEAAKKAVRPLFVFAAFKKKHDTEFKKPFQKRYVQDIKDDGILQRYK